MNGKEILKQLQQILDENDISENQLANEDYSAADEDQIVSELGPFKHLGAGRTSDGDHDRVQAVLHFLKDNIYISVNGSYSSWEGYEWNGGLSVVEPYQITVYRSVK